MGEMLHRETYVKFSEDDMTAYLCLGTPDETHTYCKEEILQILEDNGVMAGVIEENIEKIIQTGCYDQEIKIAEGVKPVDGMDGRFEFMFNRSSDKKPEIAEDGTANYWSMSVVENVAKGQTIASYIPPTPEKPGITVKGEIISARRGRELPPLKGKGFERSDDSKVYTAVIDGKIEFKNDRIYISNLYEGCGDADAVNGNIEFRGDIIIHGNVQSGVSIKATGSITIDGSVEGAQVIAGKDIILRNGVHGSNKAYIKSCGNIYAECFEMARVEAKGNILTNAIINSTVFSEDTVILTGAYGLISGSTVKGLKGVEAVTVGAHTGIKTRVCAGASEEVYLKIASLKKTMEEAQSGLREADRNIIILNEENGLRPIRIENDPRVMLWMKSRVKHISIRKEAQQELEELLCIIDKSREAYVRVEKEIYQGSRIEIDEKGMDVTETLDSVEFRKCGEEIRIFSLSEESLAGY